MVVYESLLETENIGGLLCLQYLRSTFILLKTFTQQIIISQSVVSWPFAAQFIRGTNNQKQVNNIDRL